MPREVMLATSTTQSALSRLSGVRQPSISGFLGLRENTAALGSAGSILKGTSMAVVLDGLRRIAHAQQAAPAC